MLHLFGYKFFRIIQNTKYNLLFLTDHSSIDSFIILFSCYIHIFFKGLSSLLWLWFFFLFMKINFSYLIFDVSNFSVSNWCFCLPIWHGSGAHNPYHHRKIFGSLSINWLIDFISINIINLWIFFSYDFPTKKICKRKKLETIFFLA